MKNGKFVLALVVLVGLVGLSLIAIGCTESTAFQQAQAERARAEAAKLQAAAQGEVNIVGANTDAYVRKLEAELRAYQERERFDRDLANQTFTDSLMELQKFTIAMKSAEVIATNSRTAAENSFWSLCLLFGLGLILVCVSGISFYCYKELAIRLAKIETMFNDR